MLKLLGNCYFDRRESASLVNWELSRPFLWFAAIQGIEREQDLAGLAPQGCFVSAEAIEREVGQIGETQ